MKDGIDITLKRGIYIAGFDIREYLKSNIINMSAEFSNLSRFQDKRADIEYKPLFDDFPKFEKGIQFLVRIMSGKHYSND